MGQIATMVVKIDANIVSLTKNLDKAEKAVLKSADRVMGLGKSLTMAVTLPVTVAAVAFAKMAADSQAAAARMDRVFGAASGSMNQFLTDLSKQVPETMEDLQQMSSEVKNLADNLGLAPAASVQMSKALIALASDMAAFNHETSIQPALDALEKGLAGKTKGLAAYGIVIKEADIQQEAFRMGLLHSGQQLTAAGMAIAAYNLEMRKSGSVHGEAARTAMDAQRQFAFLKRDLSEMGDQIGALVLPYVVALAKGLRDLLQWVSTLPAWVGKLTWGILAFAATAGPILMLYSAFVKIQTLFKAMQAISWLSALASPVGQVILLFTALGVAIYWAFKKWKEFHDGVTAESSKVRKDATDPTALAQLYGPLTKSAAGGNATDMATGSPLEQLEKRVSSVAEAYKYAVGHGQQLNGVAKAAGDLQTEVLKTLQAQGDAFTENAKKLRDMADQLKEVLDTQRLVEYGVVERGPAETFGINTGTLAQGLSGRAGDLDTALPMFARAGAGLVELSDRVQAALRLTKDAVAAQGGAVTGEANSLRQAQEELQHLSDVLALARASASKFDETLAAIARRDVNPTVVRVTHAERAINYGTDLRLELAFLKLPDYFDAAGEAALAYGRAMRDAARDFDTSWEYMKQGYQRLRSGSVEAGRLVKAGAGAMFDSLNGMLGTLATRIAAMNGGEVGGELGGAGVGAIATKMFGPWASGIGEVVGSAFGSALQSAIGLGGKDESQLAQLAVVRANTEALKEVALRLQGFEVNAGNTVNASNAVRAITQDGDLRFAIEWSGLMNDSAAQIDTLNKVLAQFDGLTFDQLQAIAKHYNQDLLDSNGEVVMDALDLLGQGLYDAAAAAFKFRNTLGDKQTLYTLQDKIDGKTTPQDELNRNVNILHELAPKLLPGNYDLTTDAGREALRSQLKSDVTNAANGTLKPEDFDKLQSIGDFTNIVDAIISSLDGFGSAVDKVTESLTNVPQGFKVALARFNATAPTVPAPPAVPGTDVVGPLVPTVPTPPVLVPTSPLVPTAPTPPLLVPTAPRTAIAPVPPTLTLMAPRTEDDASAATADLAAAVRAIRDALAEANGGDIVISGDINITSTATNAKDLLKELAEELLRERARAGTSLMSLALRGL